jgi:hypothetical protein
MLAAYLLGSFLAADLDIRNWHVAGRVAIAGLGIVAAAVSVAHVCEWARHE